MDLSRLKQRNSSLDIVRILAVFLVISVHFFLHNGFYSQTVSGMGPVEGIISYFNTDNRADLDGPLMFIMIQMRTLFSTCVPLFMILSGYLMSKKTLSKKYYKGLTKTLVIFVLASLVCMAFKAVHDTPAAKEAFYRFDFPTMFDAISATEKFRVREFILTIFDFTGANYSWYIEMYIGLFLIAPFINLAYNKLETKRKKQILVATLVLMTAVPTIFNIFNFQTASWWTTPIESDEFQKFIPTFWMGIYPIAYYVTGAYIRDYGIKLRTRTIVPLFVITLFLGGAFCYFRSYGSTFKSGTYIYWYGIIPYLLSVMIFVLVSRIKTDNWNSKVKLGLWKLSDLVLGAYLLSFVFDSLIYLNLKENVTVMTDRLPYYFVTVPLCFVLSMLGSFILNQAAKLVMFLYEKIKKFVKEQRLSADFMKWQDLAFAVLMLGSLILAFWKCNLGFGGYDESFYLSTPHRLLQGDAMFADEWHLSQLSSFLLLPFVWAFETFTGSTDGIILAARITYVIVHLLATFAIYTRLRKFGFASVAACVLYFIYTPYNIMALNYDSMGVELILLTGVLMATADYGKKLQLIFSGLCFAGAVLCNPYLASAYALFAVCVGAHYLIRKKDIYFVLKSEMFSIKTFLFFTAGVGILAVLFLIFLLTRASLGDVFQNLPLMLKDPEHPSISVGDKFLSYFKSIFNLHPHFKYAVYSYAVMMIALIFDKKRRLHRSVYLIVTTAIVIFTYILLLKDLQSSTYNSIMFPLLFIGITSYILCKNKPHELFAALFVLGIIYSFCIHLSSNQYFYVISMAMTAANAASVIFLGQLIKEMKDSPDNITYAVWIKRFSFAFAAFMIILQGCFQIGSKIGHIFWEAGPDDMTAEITEGPAEGIMTTPDKQQKYESMYSDIMYAYSSKPEGNVLFMTKYTWCYLAAEDMTNGAFSTWLSGENEFTRERLREYYEINPEKVPKYIYIPKDSDWEIQSILYEASLNGYTVNETVTAYQLEK